MGERERRATEMRRRQTKWLAQKKQPAMISEGNGEGEGLERESEREHERRLR